MSALDVTYPPLPRPSNIERLSVTAFRLALRSDHGIVLSDPALRTALRAGGFHPRRLGATARGSMIAFRRGPCPAGTRRGAFHDR